MALLNKRLYSNNLSDLAVSPLHLGCFGLMSTTHSSETMTDGTSKTGELCEAIQSLPSFALV